LQINRNVSTAIFSVIAVIVVIAAYFWAWRGQGGVGGADAPLRGIIDIVGIIVSDIT